MVSYPNAVALTGGIATGKSTTCNLLKLYGFHIIDADTVVHQVLDEEAPHIEQLFGKEYVQEGRVNRKKLGALVFGNKEERLKLEKLLHPKIKKRILELAQREERFGVPYFVDIPLLYERGDYPFEKVVVVYAPKEVQIERLRKRERLSLEEAKLRLAAQMDIEEKKRLADYVIDNSKDLKHLQAQIESFIERIKDDFGIG